ncbi:MAG TPA: hypothetical protein VMB27_19340 [Solirubrobacteraceae bacterium]|nr:hypothetical protein [Solirubrobacteraceae bacterium]
MFRTLERLLYDPNLTNPPPPPPPANPGVFQIHPYQLSQWLEEAWTFTANVTLPHTAIHGQPYVGGQEIISTLQLPTQPDNPFLEFLRSGIHVGSVAWSPGFWNQPEPAPGEVTPPATLPLPWDHLIYAYMIESTGALEILSEVVRRYAVGETLETPSFATQGWLRSTEELFFREPPLFHIVGLTSRLRPDMSVARRNAYWRLIGMDLPHPAMGVSGQPWKQDTGVANLRFHELWLDLLRGVWTGYENATNFSGANPTDPNYIYEICRYLRDMLQMRRLGGNLARDEFVHVSTMSWFHLTLLSDTPVVVDLRSQGTDAADRLFKLGQRVGISPAPHARELFEMADLVSDFVRFVELGYFTPATVPTLYQNPTQLRTDVIRLIDLWEMATGDSIKADAVRLSGQTQPRAQHAPPARSLAVPSAPRPPHPARPPRVPAGAGHTNGSTP